MRKIYISVVVLCSTSCKVLAKNYRHYNQNYPQYRNLYRQEVENEKNFDKINTLSFYSGYVRGLYTNRSLANFGLELANLGDLAFYETINFYENNYLNSTLGVIGGLSALYFHIIHNVAYHELGHALRAKALGIEYYLNLQRCKGYFGKKNFFNFFVANVFRCGIDGSTSMHYPKVNHLTEDEIKNLNENLFPICSIITFSGGINNSMYLAEKNFEARCENKLRKNAFTNIAYIGEKLEPFIYLFFFTDDNPDAGSDFQGILSGYQASKIKVTISHYKTAETISLLSGLLNSGIELFLYDKLPSILQRIIFPDIFVYSTSYGLSYKFVTGYKFKDMSFLRLGWEHVMHGKHRDEISLGLFHRFDNKMKPEVSGAINFGCEGINLETCCAISLLKYLRLSAGITVCATRSLFGERHATKILDIKKLLMRFLRLLEEVKLFLDTI